MAHGSKNYHVFFVVASLVVSTHLYCADEEDQSTPAADRAQYVAETLSSFLRGVNGYSRAALSAIAAIPGYMPYPSRGSQPCESPDPIELSPLKKRCCED
jgi:hypothetical protein